MTWRVMRGMNPAGNFGFWVSKPGFDVRTANKMQMAFSSDLITAKVVVTGQLSIPPINGANVMSAGRPGGRIASVTVPFGRTISPVPVLIAIGSASDWTIPLITGGPQLTYLNNVWHSFVLENFAGPVGTPDFTYGTRITRNNGDGTGSSDGVGPSWACCRFVATASADAIKIDSNCASVLKVKYLVLEY